MNIKRLSLNGGFRSELKLTLFYLAYLTATIPIWFRKIYANDVWKAIYSGRYLWWFGRFPHHSTFTYSPVKDFLTRDAFNWLGNLILYGIFSNGGPVGLQILRVTVILAAVILLHSYINFNPRPSILLVMILFTYGLSQKVTVRTALFSIPFTTLLFTGWFGAKDWNHKNWLYGLLPLLVLWGNVHGSYQLGWGLLGVLSFGGVLDQFKVCSRENHPGWWLLIVLFVILLALVYVKPFPEHSLPLKLGKIPVRILGPMEPSAMNSDADTTSYLQMTKNILQKPLFEPGAIQSAEFDFPLQEWNFIAVPASLLLGLITFILLLLATTSRWSDWLLFITGLYLGISFVRTVAYLPLICLPLLLNLVRRESVFEKQWSSWIDLIAVVLIALWSGVMGGLLISSDAGTLTGEPYHEIGLGSINRFESNIPDRVLNEFPDQRFANSYNTGGYLITRWWPHKKVLIDSKGSAYEDSFLKDLFGSRPREYLERNNIRYFLTERTNPIISSLLDSSNPPERVMMDTGLVVFDLQNEISQASRSSTMVDKTTLKHSKTRKNRRIKKK